MCHESGTHGFEAEVDGAICPSTVTILQAQAWLWSEISAELLASFKRDHEVAAKISAVEEAVTQGDLAPTTAARQLLDLFTA